MNYIWEIYLRAQEQGISYSDIHFLPAKMPSPYIEASFSEINRKILDKEPIEINGLYRFGSIFRPLQNINFEGEEELRLAVFDIIFHYLTILDLRQGLCKHEFYMLFLKYNVNDGFYGDLYRDVMPTFTIPQRAWVLSSLVKAYEEGTSLELFRSVMRFVYPQSMVYFHNDTLQEVLIYIGKKETDERRKQVLLLCELFLSLDMTVYLYWLHHFGVIDIDDTMHQDEIMIF